MNDETRSEQAIREALTDDELAQVVGGESLSLNVNNPIDPVGNATGDVEVNGKSTPILM
jgi:bacteriocin-like protein